MQDKNLQIGVLVEVLQAKNTQLQNDAIIMETYIKQSDKEIEQLKAQVEQLQKELAEARQGMIDINGAE